MAEKFYLGASGKLGDLKAFISALEDVGLENTDRIHLSDEFAGKLHVRVNYEDFGLYDPATGLLTVFPVETPAAAESDGE